MASVVIQKRKRKKFTSYLLYFKDPMTGKFKYYKTLRKSKEAQKAAQDLRSLIDNGQIAEFQDPKIKMLTFSQVAELKRIDWKKQLGKNELSIVTFEDYTTRLNVLMRSFGKKLMCKIQEKDLANFQQTLLEDHSPSTSNRYMFILKQLFKKAKKAKAVLTDPAEPISYLNENEHRRNKFVTPIELDKLIEASQQIRAKFYMPALIYLGAEHGASKQEALSLEWDDLDFDFNEYGTINLFRTKNGIERTEYLMPRTKKALVAWKAHLEWMRHRNRIVVAGLKFVFTRLDGTPIKRFNKAWNNTC